MKLDLLFISYEQKEKENKYINLLHKTAFLYTYKCSIKSFPYVVTFTGILIMSDLKNARNNKDYSTHKHVSEYE